MKRVLMGGLGLLLLSAGLALAEPVIWVLDGSDSMKQTLGPTAKTNLVQKTLLRLSTDWDKQTPFGIISDGAPGKRCDSVTTLRPLALPDTPATLNTQLRNYRASGQSALGQAIQTAATAANYTQAPATILVITDGGDDCAVDLCALSQQLKTAAAGKLTIQVLGLAVNPQQEASLRCLAEHNNGQYAAIATHPQLLSASKAALGRVFKRSPVTLTAVYTENQAITGNSLWKLYQLNADNSRKEHTTTYSASLQLELPPGRYLATVRHDRLTAELAFETAEGQPVTRTIPLGGGQLKISLALTSNPAPIMGTWRIYQTDATGKTTQVAGQSNRLEPVFSLPPGSYTVKVSRDSAEMEKTIELADGQTLTETLTLTASEVKPQALLPETEPKELTWIVYQILDKNQQKQRLTSAQESPTFILPAGQYRLEAQQVNGFKGEQVLTVGADTSVLKPQIKLNPPQ